MARTTAAEPVTASLAAPPPGQGGRGKVLVVGGTHGNERNGPWLLDAWRRHPPRLAAHGLAITRAVGNPEALSLSQRYVERDLNRSFEPALLADPSCDQREVARARALLAAHGPAGEAPCLVAIDLHSTTAAMGNSLVLYGRRPADLALAAALQRQLGLPIYLHEADARQSGFLVERWPCGLVIEVGPVPQGVLTAAVVEQTALALEASLEVLAGARRGQLPLPRQLVVHRHLASLDLPRQADGSPAALIHPRRQHRDWQPLEPGDPLFLADDGRTLSYVPPPGLEGRRVWPVFINEAAYGEKGIALSLTAREIWPLEASWGPALLALAGGLESA
jgi:aspartoacylase